MSAGPRYIRRDATLSPCGTYRYRLHRAWDDDRPTMVWVMLNPSTADGEVDDPTIRRCVGFADRFGFGSITVANLFAYRTAYPRNLVHAAVDTVGPDNDATLRELAADAAGLSGAQVVAAWGAWPGARARAADVVAIALEAGATLYRAGTLTKDGCPRHPLYLAAGTSIGRYRWPGDPLDAAAS